MGNKSYKMNEEVEVTLKVKVTLTRISDYNDMDDERQTLITEEFKEEIGNELADKLSGEHQQQDLLLGCDWVDYYVALCDIDTEGVEDEDEEEETSGEIPTHNLDNEDDWGENYTLEDFVTGDDEWEDECFIIYKGVKYHVNGDGYTVKQFVKDYGSSALYQFIDHDHLVAASGFIEVIED